MILKDIYKYKQFMGELFKSVIGGNYAKTSVHLAVENAF
jgi:hypothetical protein